MSEDYYSRLLARVDDALLQSSAASASVPESESELASGLTSVADVPPHSYSYSAAEAAAASAARLRG